MSKKWITKGLMALGMLTQEVAMAQSSSSTQRPPQFVLLAFDGSYNNDVWQYSRDFTKLKKSHGVDSRFTYFINPVYFLTPDSKSNYQPPGSRLESRNGQTVAVKNRGSAIGWGDDNADVSTRIDHMNDAYLEGHEIGSHAVGHFDAGYAQCSMNKLTRKCDRDENNKIIWKWDLRWSEADWRSEFEQFYSILDNVFRFNGLRPTAKQSRGLLFRDEIKGFRAPVLGISDGLWPNLPKYGIQYDTSKTNYENYWPQRNDYGTWNFPLAEILEPGGARRWISMDYNFCVRDSARVLTEEPETMSLMKRDANGQQVKANKARDCLNMVSAKQKAKAKANMMNLYRAYFDRNYYGNRAPIHIGHHFSQWMGGAYFETFFEFANEVCGKPEVKCVTYAELMNFMNGKSSSEIEAYKKGNFAKLPRPKSVTLARHWDLDVDMTSDENVMKFALSGRDASRRGLTQLVTVNGTVVSEGLETKLSEVRRITPAGETADVRMAIFDFNGKEVATATYKVMNVGTKDEMVSEDNIEERWTQGHLPEAHQGEMDFTRGH
ncbi:hypothetical protein [Bdellovibrio bacteriovorus]|uniref:hypothetical protein n=1 Tax=Bdellovibrio bacteriovorus TaxID=959 RepID=UPI0035A5F0C1